MPVKEAKSRGWSTHLKSNVISSPLSPRSAFATATMSVLPLMAMRAEEVCFQSAVSVVQLITSEETAGSTFLLIT